MNRDMRGRRGKEGNGKELNTRIFVYTFVLATPISGPALICTPQCVSLLIELPTVLVIPTVRAPLDLQ